MSDDATKPSSEPGTDAGWFARWRSVLAWVALVLAVIVLLVSSLTVWVRRQALNTNAWTNASGELLQDPTVRTALATYLVDELFSTVNVTQELQDRLPAQLDPLAAAAAATVRGAAVNQANALLASPRVQSAWEEANRLAHTKLLSIINEDATGLVASSNGDVVLNVRGVLDRLRSQLGLSASRLPETSGQIVIMRADQLENARKTVRAIKVLTVFFALLALALFAAAIWLGVGRRRRIITAAGCGLLLVAVILALVRRVAGNYVVDALVTSDSGRPAADAAWLIGTSLLRDIALALAIYGIVILIGVWISGPGRLAVRARAGLAPAFRSYPWVLFGIVVLLLLLLLLWGPGSDARTWVGVIVLAVGMLGGTELLRRQTLREFPESARTA